MKKLLPVSLLCLTACSMPYRPAQFMEPGATFPGLAHFVEQTPGHQVDVLLVHGMCTHDAGWAAQTVQQLSSALAARLPPAAARATAAPGQIEIIPAVVPAGDGAIRFQSLIWSPLTTPLKQQLCYDQSGKSPLCQGSPPYTAQRAGLNARVKDLLMDDCLPDALIYQGQARGQIQQRMRDAVLRATAGAAPDAPLVVISESLGSKILFDTLSNMLDDDSAAPDARRAADAAQQTLDRMAYLVMAANQIPILGLADQGLPLDVGRRALPQDSLQRVLERRRARSAAAAPASAPASMGNLTLVAFTDPNDLLSYTLQKERYERPGVVLHNVLVSNARTWFGAFENPVDAHVRYLDNPDVGRLIACGEPKSPLCR
ncbi:hypothetical protein ASC94_22880 [Massilia sp. Root418]|jgi:hypothetical protein|uniref:hypothetical protein n=1 Tax=Massilia sp. Root418 TaxID=1736532 RepID=UPI0006FAD28C|nr:hypothetical protein [Massilia sp. Root418]KQW89278.1 hypothetical protein ASC94_22880 [Massilia sp. Root418]